MQELKDRILRDGQVLDNGILKVDSFVNHQVDAALMDSCGKEFAAALCESRRNESVDRGNLRHRSRADHSTSSRTSSGVRAQNQTGHHARSGLFNIGAFAYQRPHGGIDRLAGISGGWGKSFDH